MTEIVGALQTIAFRGGGVGDRAPKVVYTPPRNTLDPRYEECTDHRVACDCREAEFAEERAEYRFEREAMQAAFDEHLAGHPTRLWDDKGNDLPGCQCTGCRIARAVEIWPRTAVES